MVSQNPGLRSGLPEFFYDFSERTTLWIKLDPNVNNLSDIKYVIRDLRAETKADGNAFYYPILNKECVNHGLINYKDTKTKCRLYWCLIQFRDWC